MYGIESIPEAFIIEGVSARGVIFWGEHETPSTNFEHEIQ